ncbi:hypothetical protein SVIO_093670 [Streptomyces violaceusniger]|uniref:Blue (type 1) copper domain-containing protein n=1 Tax=Streptomyces violaceusniger TaxID=68280 RepID=A0A4D4LEI9_STRVO|nr:hypothetical protein SVIO_093670 [Streptomyces violaceusniger]
MTVKRRRPKPIRPWLPLLAALLMVLGLSSATATVAYGQDDTRQAVQQTLTWTAGDDITKYSSAPTTAVAGKATIVFENSTATGNTMGMPHTLTFDVSDPEYNNDVPLNILANPSDDSGGKHTAEVTLSPGRYRYHCTIPGHGQMQGILVVTDGGGARTPPRPRSRRRSRARRTRTARTSGWPPSACPPPTRARAWTGSSSPKAMGRSSRTPPR